MRKTLMAATAAASLALPGVANATFVVTYPSSQAIPTAAPAPNSFWPQLASFGLTRFASTGATINLASAGKVKFEVFGSEAALRNVFTAVGLDGTATFTNVPGISNFFAAPINLGTFSFAGGAFAPFFNSNGTGPNITPGSKDFGIALPSGAGAGPSSFLGDSIWLMFDDNDPYVDDNHDDIIIRATFAVPELSTWAMMLAGFGIMGFLMRQRRPARVSFV